MAIQLASQLGAQVLTTAGTPEKLALCASLGADVTINYRDEDFVEVAREATDGHGADVILDNMGAKYLARNLDALAIEGRLVVIGMQGGSKAGSTSRPLRKRGAVIATSLRARPTEEGRDLRGSRGARVAARRRRTGTADRGAHAPARRGPRGARAHGVGRAHRQDPSHPLRPTLGSMTHKSAGAGAGAGPGAGRRRRGVGSVDNDQRAITELVEQPAKVMPGSAR